MKTYVVGHKNPDTDSLVSAIALAEMERQRGKDYVPAKAGELNKETKFVLNKFGFKEPDLVPAEEKNVVLVDHNELSQIHENVKPEEIVEIVDHHKLGGLSLSLPIAVRIIPIGSSSSIITRFFNACDIIPSKGIASLLIAGIISDTLNLTSPTTTEKDKKMLKYLNTLAGLDTDKLANEMFQAKSDISDISTKDLIEKDYKIFELKGKKIGIGVWETVLPDPVVTKKIDILEALKEKKENDGIDQIYFAVVDILNSNATMFVIGEEEEEIIKKAYDVETKANIAVLPGVVSRKKQIAPVIEKVL